MDALAELRAIIGRHARRGAATALPRLQLARSFVHRSSARLLEGGALQFQKRLRLQHARTRLLSQSGDVTSVARSVGYQSPSQFIREYRREFGLPPAEEAARWRRDAGRRA